MRRSEHADAYFEIDEASAPVVREIFRRYAHAGETLAAIADWLNDNATPTKSGKAWHPSTVRGMLVNPAYRGEAAFGKTRVTGARGKATRRARQRGARHSLAPQRASAPEESWTMIAVPAIIDADTFALARSRLERGVRFASRNAKKPSLLRGLLVCRDCGYAWHRVEKGKPQSRRVYYQCGSRCLRTAERRCNSAPVRAEELEPLVWAEIRHLLCEPDLVRAEIDRRLQSMRETDPAARRGETLTTELTRAERAISRLVDAYQDEQITLDELRARMPELRRRESALRAERDAIEAEIDDAASCLKLIETLEAFTGRLAHRLDELDTSEQARILQLLVRDILIGGDDETVTIRHSIPLPSGGENPGSPLQTVRHRGCSQAPRRGGQRDRGQSRRSRARGRAPDDRDRA